LDDYHSAAPLHSASVLLPALIAAVDSTKTQTTISGAQFLLAAVVGFETGPRVGNALHGANMLSMGWHSGPVFGSPAAAAATSKLFELPPREIESALGIACTQAGGLMAAQYEGMVKRIQHSFAARNGLFGAMLAREGYVGMKKILERPYGGFLSMFSKGCDRDPQYEPKEVVRELGSTWHTNIIRTKLHACVGGCHGQIELLAKMQAALPDRFARSNLPNITRIKVSLSEPVFAHCGWKASGRSIDATGGQMNAAYIGAVQLIDSQVLLSQFAADALDRDEVWDLVEKTECVHSTEFDRPHHACGARICIEFRDGHVIEDALAMPKGFDPPVTNGEIVEKWRKLATTVIDSDQTQKIEDCVLGIENISDISVLGELLGVVAGKALG
jgi:aconitate decarboxylase